MRQKQSKTGAHSGSDTALLLIDFINDLEFPGGEKLLPQAIAAAKRAAALKKRNEYALKYLARVLKADTTAFSELVVAAGGVRPEKK